MPEEPMSDGLTGVSTTLLMALAAVGAALLPILGEHDGMQASTVVFALLGLVPWALVVGGVRLSPWLFCALALVPGVLILAIGDNSGGMFPLMLALVYLVWSSPSLVPAAVIVVAGLAALVELTIDKGSADDSGIVYFAGGLGISWMSGALLRRQEALTAQVRAMRDVEVERRAATERAHLAREVHDVVAHSLTVVMLNLTGARRALSTDPAGADAALARAEVVGRDSLDSIRQVMDLLREPDAAAAPATLRLAAVPRLVDGFRAAGLDVVLTMPEVPPTMEPSGELVVYRVVQESLSNVLQHAPGAAADVALAADPIGLTITVRNGPAPTVAVANGGRRGLGTLGMAERVRAVGGTFEAGADAAGGWLVTAWLPVLAPAVPAPAGRRG
jgi:signal transduction histidine kinase